ncbi:MAG: putative zinc-binding metallopeptidase [Bacteriovoracaceae bacterium]|nr:putative zinc-binding metallopeptidase [Bacteriovoracaceae bacterium]
MMIGNQKIEFDELCRSFVKVQAELEEIGLWFEDYYLGEVDLVQSPLPSLLGEMGYVYDSGLGFFDEALGYEEGVIYIPKYAPVQAYTPGGTLVDTIRHEFAHAWTVVDPELFEKKWFVNTFGLEYWDEDELGQSLYKLFRKYEVSAFENSPYFDDYVSSYALSAPCEDFAETFMFFLRYRKSLKRFKHRPGVYRKLMSIKKIISELSIY